MAKHDHNRRHRLDLGHRRAVASGQPEDLRVWFPGTWPLGAYKPGMPQHSLAQLVWKQYAESDDCRSEVTFDRAWPTVDGMIFHPTANAYINRPCKVDVLVRWKALAPLLSKLGLQRMQGLEHN